MNKDRETLKTLLEEIGEAVEDNQIENLLRDLMAGTAVKLIANMDDQRTVVMHVQLQKARVI